jgi:hypothetical protein
MLASAILTDARYTLSDTNKKRWTDARLLSLLYQGIVEAAQKTTLFQEELYITLTNGLSTIDLSDRALVVYRVEYLDEPVEFKSYEEMDKSSSTWQKVIGPKLLKVVYDKSNRGVLKLYPTIENSVNTNIEYSSPFGIVTGLTYTEITLDITTDFGDLSSVDPTGYVKVFYRKKPAVISDITTELEVDDVLHEPLTHYVIGMALRDNTDAQNRAMGKEEIALFYEQIDQFSIAKSKNFARADNIVEYKPYE